MDPITPSIYPVDFHAGHYNCRGCKRDHQGFYVLAPHAIPSQFVNTPERWSCPNGCTWSGYPPVLKSGLDGKSPRVPISNYNFYIGHCNILKKGRNCFVRFQELPILTPNYSHTNMDRGSQGELGLGINNGPRGTNNNTMPHHHDALIPFSSQEEHFNSNINTSMALQPNIRRFSVRYPEETSSMSNNPNPAYSLTLDFSHLPIANPTPHSHYHVHSNYPHSEHAHYPTHTNSTHARSDKKLTQSNFNTIDRWFF
jgi:hypothetical protein